MNNTEREVIDIITIKEIRTDVLKQTQQELAEKLGITTAAYCRKEKGNREFKWREVLKICDLSGIDPRTIID